MSGLKQRSRIEAAIMREIAAQGLTFIAPPVDVSDEAAFPNIAAAIAHARRLRGVA
jgi:hypothetical protein